MNGLPHSLLPLRHTPLKKRDLEFSSLHVEFSSELATQQLLSSYYL